MNVTLCDPRYCGGHPTMLDYTPRTDTGFMMWRGELREIREVHQTRNGIQIELY